MDHDVTNGISIDRRAGVSLRGVGGAGGASGAGLAEGAMSAVAGRVASALGKELRLFRDDRDSSQPGSGADPYAIDALAAEVSAELGGSPADAGSLARALHSFAQESAAIIGARPESRSVAAIQQAIGTGQAAAAAAGDARTVPDVVAMIDRATLALTGR